MNSIETIRTHGSETIKRAREAMVVSLGTIITDLVAHNAAGMQAGANLSEHAIKAIPSAFEPAQVSDDFLGRPNAALDLAIDLAPLTASTVLLRREDASTKDIVKLGLSAQLLATSADAALAEGHLLGRAEMAQRDVGSSALTTAFFTKFLFDKVARSESERQRRMWQVVTGVFVGAITVGAAYVDSKNFTTDLSSHSVAAGAGAYASWRGNRSADDAAAQDFVPSVEHG